MSDIYKKYKDICPIPKKDIIFLHPTKTKNVYLCTSKSIKERTSVIIPEEDLTSLTKEKVLNIIAYTAL